MHYETLAKTILRNTSFYWPFSFVTYHSNSFKLYINSINKKNAMIYLKLIYILPTV